MSSLTNTELASECFSDFQQKIWGYGQKRIYIGDTSNNTYRNNFSGFGYKDEKECLMLGVRWNKFIHLNAKFRVYQQGDNIMEKWTEIIKEFKTENNTA